ncbi:zinc ribbon domain-containing protein [Stutzerimonas stutzeri]|uniref:zinc ribbon domain-containing protein n=1 Tax=Stutzerimonas stutzeri TaxID=316 RepID=UPI001BCACD28|nr:zinc ribbon domain-containing protein [Stutzerimonas stutzeri]
MALIECPECKKQISDQAKVCPGCGAKAPREPKSYAWLWTILILFAGFVWYSVVSGNDPKTKQMRVDRQAYQWCMDEMKKSLNNPIVAGACAKMRTEFRAKYNREP